MNDKQKLVGIGVIGLGSFLLEKHIRFEERELFEVAQNTLNPDVLSEIERACHVKCCEE